MGSAAGGAARRRPARTVTVAGGAALNVAAGISAAARFVSATSAAPQVCSLQGCNMSAPFWPQPKLQVRQRRRAICNQRA